MTREWFEGQMTRLVGLRFAPASLDTHWEALRDLPDGVLEAAITRAQRTCEHFPTPVELRWNADLTKRGTEPDEDRSVELAEPVTIGTLPTGTPITATRIWSYYCETCEDAGLESLWCGTPDAHRKPWQPLVVCERTKPHDPHEWVRKCACWATNPALVKKRERQQQYAEPKQRRSA